MYFDYLSSNEFMLRPTTNRLGSPPKLYIQWNFLDAHQPFLLLICFTSSGTEFSLVRTEASPRSIWAWSLPAPTGSHCNYGTSH